MLATVKISIIISHEIPPINHVLAMTRRCLNFEGENLIKNLSTFRCFDIRQLLGGQMGYVRAGHLYIRQTVGPVHHYWNWSLSAMQR